MCVLCRPPPSPWRRGNLLRLPPQSTLTWALGLRRCPVGARAVSQGPGGLSDGPGGPLAPGPQGHCVIAAVRAASNRAVTCDKLWAIIPTPGENPAVGLNRLTEPLTQYSPGPASPAGATVLATHYISSPPRYPDNIKEGQGGPSNSHSPVKTAFKVFHTERKWPNLRGRLDSS